MELFEEALMYLQNENVAAGSDLLEEVFTDDSFDQSPLETGPFTLPDVGTKSTSEYLLEKRLVVLRGILNSEQLYLNELETLLMPMKALKATAGTSQPVLSCQDIQTVFFQVPELLALHRDFYQSLKARLEGATELGEGLRNEQRQGVCRSLSAEQGLGNEQRQGVCRSLSTEQGLVVEQCKDHYKLSVGDLFQKLVSQLATYRGFIDNYESAVEIVRSCTQTDERFRILAESMKSGKGSDNSQSEYTFEALLYKPLDRVTKTTLVLHDLLSHTPPDHHDNPLLQEALRISSSFLAGLNETSQCKRAVTLSKGMRRQLMHDGFVVCVCENGRSLRHLFLYTDLLLCAKLKTGTLGRHSQYRYCWYTPLFGLKVRWAGEQEHPPELQQRISCMKAKMYHLRQTLTQQTKKGCHSRFVDRIHRKLQECELWLLTHSPNLPLQLHSTSGKSHTLLMSSLYKLEEWREAMDRLIGENTETVPPDLLTLTNSCVKLRMTQQPHLESLQPPESAELSLCGTLSVVVHAATGLQQPACVCVHVEVDGFEFYSNKAQTHSSFNSLEPQWNQEISFQVDGAKSLRIVCVIQSENSEEDRVVGHGSLKLDPAITKKWKKLNLPMGQLDLTLSIKYLPHPLDPPSSTFTQQLPVFCVPIEVVSQLEGVLVPRVVRSCAEEVERRGLEEEGMYRTSGSAKEIQLLKHTFDTNLREAVKCVKTAEVNVVSGTLKLYFRDLPEPLVPADLYHSLKNALDLPDLTSKQNALLNILRSCPDVNRNTLLYLFHHLRKVAGRVEVNKMSVMNLATVFGPSLLRPPVARVDISEEVVVQVQVVYFYLKCENLPTPLTCLPFDTEDEQETIM
ncbi:active breakpoint cluster region-related protein isoform X2 [Clupea harengus]|uniref:Active breakpoint cluster region-related protein isoform X2 n=1 Tax=Clupea harengus TaxID=7950 RepID=A0A6P8GQS6_CLUHA|nr:active breakpoint cluster region-related protein isoform X2 [Clupea harengus]